MTVYCGVDFHARQQTVCYCDTADGALRLSELEHEGDNVRGFYSRFTADVVVGTEASGYSTWFVELLEGRSRLLSREGRAQFLRLEMSEAMTRQREEWLSLVDDLNRRIKSLDAWLDERARRDERVMRLQTHPGIGLLTSLALVHALEPVSRVGGGRKVAAYVGLTPAQHSSGDVVRMGRITRSGKNSSRGTLVEAAWRMVSKDSAMRKQYEQIKARAGAKRAIVAVARRLLLRARRMLLDGRAYVAEPVAA